MSYQFTQDEPDRTVEVKHSSGCDLTLTQTDYGENFTVYRRIRLTVVEETQTDYIVEMEVLERFHDGPMPDHIEGVPIQGDHDDRVVTEQFDKNNLEDLPNFKSGVNELEQLKKPLVEWHERTSANLSVPY